MGCPTVMGNVDANMPDVPGWWHAPAAGAPEGTALQGLAPVHSAFGLDMVDNHCPMMVEAMLTLGRPDAVMPWVEQAVRGHPTAPPPVRVGARFSPIG